MELFYIHTLTERQLMLVLALLVSVILFVPALTHHLNKPARFLTRFSLLLESKLNRSRRNAATRVYRGIVLLGFMLALTIGVALLCQMAVRGWPPLAYAEIILLAWLIPARPLWNDTRTLSHALKKRDTKQAILAAKPIARRHDRQLDDHTLARLGIEYLAENFADKIVSPVCWYLLLGLPGIMALRMINMLDGLIGHRSKRYIAFGWATAKLDDLLQWLPARLSAFYLCLAAFFVPRSKPLAGLRTALAQAHKTASPNSGWPIATTAGALHVTLGGPREVGEGVVPDAWIGKGTVKASPRDLSRAQWLYVVSVLLLGLSLAVAALLRL